MKLSKRQLKRIIREEKRKIMETRMRPNDYMIRMRNEEPDPTAYQSVSTPKSADTLGEQIGIAIEDELGFSFLDGPLEDEFYDLCDQIAALVKKSGNMNRTNKAGISKYPNFSPEQ
tara:strand:- start:238 stop:585 length:348 start_codon:yes stop_codon:yes gene_type:complete